VGAYFFDSSGIVKRFIAEIGTAWVISIVSPLAGNRIYLARITGVEVVSAITRRGRGGSLSAAAVRGALAQFRQQFTNIYRIVGMTQPVLTHAMALAEAYALRGYDAVQLAAALNANAGRLAHKRPALTFVSADGALNAAAAAEGLATDDPHAHP
jgi:uncharacterized protein